VNERAKRMATAEIPLEGTKPEEGTRLALRRAIADRKDATAQCEHLDIAVQLAQEVCGSAERLLSALSDVDVAIVEQRAEEFKRVAAGGLLDVLSLPEHLESRRKMRDMAAEQLTRARAAYDDLAGQAAQAEAAMEQAAVDVAKAACAVLLEEGAKQGLALKKIWEELSHQRDRVTAFADCQIYYTDIPFPITLPSETAKLLQTLAAIDGRQIEYRDDAAKAGEAWCVWFKALLSDAEAELNFDQAIHS
jgi:hypothetical protein